MADEREILAAIQKDKLVSEKTIIEDFCNGDRELAKDLIKSARCKYPLEEFQIAGSHCFRLREKEEELGRVEVKAASKTLAHSIKASTPDQKKIQRYYYRCNTRKVKIPVPWGEIVDWVKKNHPELTDEKYQPQWNKTTVLKKKSAEKDTLTKRIPIKKEPSKATAVMYVVPDSKEKGRVFEILQVKVSFSVPELQEIATALRQNGGRPLAAEIDAYLGRL